MKNSINNEPKNKIYEMAKIFEPKGNLNKSKTLNPSKLKDTSLNLDDWEELESEEDLDYQDFYNTMKNGQSLKEIITPKEIPADFSKEQVKKIFDLKKSTENIISKTVKNKGSSNMVKSLVSKKKNRFCYDGFDLDLAYITERIIAMGFPSVNLEGLYRNPMDEVQKFLSTRHYNHYKVYNLCKEKDYPRNSFYKQDKFPFEDHEAPPLNLMKSFCEDAKRFLEEDNKNIVAIHCKAGKGRTGTMICCLLLYMKIFDTAKESLYYYGIMRAANGEGVTIPSQKRYVNYFEQILKEKMPHPILFKKKKIIKIRMFTLPTFGKGIIPYFKIKNNGFQYISENKRNDTKKEELTGLVDYDIENGFLVTGDVKIIFYRNKFLKNEKIFKLWFNTNFIPNDCNIYQFKKEEIDKACKDKKCKYYSESFKLEIHFTDA